MTSVAAGGRPRAARLTRSDGTALRVLVVDDEPSITELLSLALRYEGWEVRTAATGADAVRIARDVGADVALHDLVLPDMDGFEVLRRLRAEQPLLPVVFLSARDAVADRIAGLSVGGHDYVTKPVGIDEMVARLGALLRRPGTAVSDDGRLVGGDLALDENSNEVLRGGEEIRLTATEFELLRYLMLNPRRVLSRAKIDEGREPMIHTVRGAGHVLMSAAS